MIELIPIFILLSIHYIIFDSRIHNVVVYDRCLSLALVPDT